MSIQVNLSFKKMYAELCDECQKKVKQLVREQIEEKAIKQLLEEDDTK